MSKASLVLGLLAASSLSACRSRPDSAGTGAANDAEARIGALQREAESARAEANAARARADALEANMTAPAGQAAPDAAAPAPSYSTGAYCARIGEVAGGSYVIERTCREQEAEALAAIRRQPLPARVRSYCDELGRTAGGSYVIFKTCAEQELEAAAGL